MSDYSRPTVTITLPKIDGYHIGQLLYMLEYQTAITGALYHIDPFSQPGVEQAINYTYALMGRAGYEDSAHTIQDKMNSLSTIS
jgi:glucose-6-phosphate isomerase